MYARSRGPLIYIESALRIVISVILSSATVTCTVICPSKPVDEDELTAHLNKVREELEEKKKRSSAIEYYSEKARNGILSLSLIHI